ncbi:MAG: FlgO family outer membrane protein [Maribacter sp.]
MSKLFQELKRRNVFKETIAYLVVAWLILQVVSIILPIWNVPDWILQVITITLALGLPLWIAFSWHYQFTSSGIKKTKNLSTQAKSSRLNKVLNVTTMIALVATIGLIWINPSMVTSKSGNKLSIAVLPFTNMSNDKSNDWFSVGVTEDILTHLSKVEGLRVISRTSVMQYKNSNKSLPEIAKELNVSYVVEGSVRKQNNQVLITAQLIDANDEHIWADKYNENLVDAFKIQQDVSKKIVSQLKIYVSPEEEEALVKANSTNVLALELFSRGRSIADSRTNDNLKRSIELYKETIKLDTLFAEAYAEIANSYVLLNSYGDMSWEESKKQAHLYIDKSLKINPNISRSYSVLGIIAKQEDNWTEAKTNFEKAIAINPNDATAHHHYALYFRDKPKPDPKNLLKQISEAQRLDPLSRPVNQMKFHALLTNNKVGEAKIHFEKSRFLFRPEMIIYNEGLLNSLIKKDLRELIYSYERALKKDPDNLNLLQTLSDYYRWILLDNEKSLQVSKRMFEIDPTTSKYVSDKLNYLNFTNQFEEANKILNDKGLMKLLSPFQKIVFLHDYYSFQGNYEKAVSYLEQLKELNLNGYYFNSAWSYSRRGEAKTTYEIIDNADYNPNDWAKTLFFSNLKESDSLFHYLNKISNYAKLDSKYYFLMSINGGHEIDPYRKDPRYIEILRKNYFPVETQKN